MLGAAFLSCQDHGPNLETIRGAQTVSARRCPYHAVTLGVSLSPPGRHQTRGQGLVYRISPWAVATRTCLGVPSDGRIGVAPGAGENGFTAPRAPTRDDRYLTTIPACENMPKT